MKEAGKHHHDTLSDTQKIATAVASVREALESEHLTAVEKNEVLSAVVAAVKPNHERTHVVLVLRPFFRGIRSETVPQILILIIPMNKTVTSAIRFTWRASHRASCVPFGLRTWLKAGKRYASNNCCKTHNRDQNSLGVSFRFLIAHHNARSFSASAYEAETDILRLFLLHLTKPLQAVLIRRA